MPRLNIPPTPAEASAHAALESAAADYAALPGHASGAASANSVPVLRVRVAALLSIVERLSARVAALELEIVELRRVR